MRTPEQIEQRLNELWEHHNRNNLTPDEALELGYYSNLKQYLQTHPTYTPDPNDHTPDPYLPWLTTGAEQAAWKKYIEEQTK